MKVKKMKVKKILSLVVALSSIVSYAAGFTVSADTDLSNVDYFVNYDNETSNTTPDFTSNTVDNGGFFTCRASERMSLKQDPDTTSGHGNVWASTLAAKYSNAVTRITDINIDDFVAPDGVTIVEFDIKFGVNPRFLVEYRKNARGTTCTQDSNQLVFSQKASVYEAEGYKRVVYADNGVQDGASTMNNVCANGTTARPGAAYTYDEWTKVKMVFDQRGETHTAKFYINDTLIGEGHTYTYDLAYLRFVDIMGAEADTDMYYIDNFRVGTLNDSSIKITKNVLVNEEEVYYDNETTDTTPDFTSNTVANGGFFTCRASERMSLKQDPDTASGHGNVWASTPAVKYSNAFTRITDINIDDFVASNGVTTVEFDIKFGVNPRFLVEYRKNARGATCTKDSNQLVFSQKASVYEAEGMKRVEYGENGKLLNGTMNNVCANGTTVRPGAAYTYDEWTKVKMVFDQSSETHTAKFYINDTLIGEGHTYTYDLAYLRFVDIMGAEANTDMYYVDNFKVTTEKTKPVDASTFEPGDELTITYSVKNIATESNDFLTIYALYDSRGACRVVNFETIEDVAVGADGTKSLTIQVPSGTAKVSAFLWDNWNTLDPQCAEKTAVLNTAN